MTSRFSACVLALLLFCYSSDSYEPSTLPDIRDPKFIEECVQTHNRFRSGVDPPASNMLYMVRESSWLIYKCVALRWCLRFFKTAFVFKCKQSEKNPQKPGVIRQLLFKAEKKALIFRWLYAIGYVYSFALTEIPQSKPEISALSRALSLCCVRSRLVARHHTQLGSRRCAFMCVSEHNFHAPVSESRACCQTALESFL